MSEFKGTKGKWEFVHTNQHPTEEKEWHSVVQMPKIAISITNTKLLSKEESKANAKIIACAPEMLEMLEDILTALRGENFIVTASEIEQLIKKATE